MRRSVAFGVAVGLGMLLALDAVAARAGLVAGAVPKLAGPALWVASRAAGVTAFFALTLAVAFGLLVSTGAADKVIPRASSVEAHRWLSAAALAMTALHAAALLGDRAVRFDVLDLLVPFLSAYRPFAVALGVAAGYVALVVHESFSWRKQIGARAWRSLHYASFVAYAAALSHGVLAGTDAGALGWVYVASGVCVGSLIIYRVSRARGLRAASRRA